MPESKKYFIIDSSRCYEEGAQKKTLGIIRGRKWKGLAGICPSDHTCSWRLQRNCGWEDLDEMTNITPTPVDKEEAEKILSEALPIKE